jgi:hypothetical protein
VIGDGGYRVQGVGVIRGTPRLKSKEIKQSGGVFDISDGIAIGFIAW